MSERNKGIALAVLVLVAVLVWYYERSGDP